jgi:hypothetical protein
MRRAYGIVAILASLSASSVVAQAPTSTDSAPSEANAASEGEAAPSTGAAASATAPPASTPPASTPASTPPASPPAAPAAPPATAPANAPTVGPAAPSVSQDDLPPGLRTAAVDPEPMFEREPEVERAPWRVLASVGVGTSVRLVQNLELQQERFAPAYVELRGGVALPQRGRVGHELSLAATTNLSGDGTYTSGIDPFGQWAIAPAYAVRVGFPAGPVPDFVLRGRLGVPLVLAPDLTWGVEVDASITYAILAGLGAYVELGYATYFGAEDRAGDLTVHPLLAFELGVSVDWEVLR